MINCKKCDNTAYGTAQYFTSPLIMTITKVVGRTEQGVKTFNFFGSTELRNAASQLY